MLKFTVYIFSLIIVMSGCSTIKEDARGFLGISTKALEDARPQAAKETFRYDYNSCYNQTKKILKDMGAYIYTEDKNKKLIAVYVSETDTTPVGIFFKEIDAANTQIEVSSLSSYAKETIATKVFARLIIALNPLKEQPKEK